MALKVGELYASFGIDSSDLGKALSGIEKQCEQAAKTLAKTGAGLTLAVTTPLVSLGKDILKSSIDFESAFAGVKKTVDSDALKQAGMSYDTLSDALKRMTLEAPQTAEALAGIMEAGGQLGIDVTALEGFTKTIAALGVATNMTTDEAASMFAKFANITGMSQTEFENLGSTIVALGNNFATTENDIMTMAMRMASAGTTIGMSETDILAFATAMSSVGIMAEVGGSSFSTFASNLSLAVATSSDDLKTYASIAGMSAEQFKTAFEQDAASAINTFIQGLNDVDRNGMSAIQLLDKLGIKEVGMRNMLLSLANSGTLLSDALEMSASAWESNIALLEEANQRYGTTESQIQIMKNALELIKVDLGDFALPKVKDLTGHVVAATKAFLGMDDATKIAMLKMGGLAAAAGPALTAIGGLVGLAGNLVPMLGAVVGPVGILGAGLAMFAVAAVDANNDIGKSLEKISLTAKKSLTSGNASLTKVMTKAAGRIPAIARSMVNVIGNTVPGIIQLGFTALSGFANTIDQNAEIIADVGMSLVENVCSGLAEGLPKFIPAAARMVTGIGSAMISNLPRLASTIGEVASSIWDGLHNVNWLDLGSQIWNAIKSGIKDTGDWIKKVALGDAYTPDASWSAVGSAIWTAIKSGISEKVDWIKQAVLGEDYIPDASWHLVGLKIWDSIKSGIVATGDWLAGVVLPEGTTFEAGSGWSSVGKSVWEAVKGGISASGDWLAALIMPEGTTFEAGTGWSSIGKSIWEAIKGGVSATGDWLSGLIMPANTTFTAGAGWKTIGSSVWTAIQGGISVTGDWLAALIMPANTTFTAGTGWSTIGQAIWTAIQSGISATGDWVKSLVLGTSYTADAGWSTVGSAIWTSIKSGISATGDWVKSLVLGSAYAADAGWNIVGSAIWGKIASGITATGDWVKGLILGEEYTADAGWSTIGKSIWAKIQTGITATGDWIKSLILGNAFTPDSDWTDVGEKIVGMISSGLSAIDFSAETMAANLSSLGNFVQTFVQNMLENKVELGTSITTFVTNLVTEISSFNGWATLATTFGTIATSLIDGIVSAIPKVAAGATNFITAIGGMLTSPATKDFLAAATNTATSIVNSIVAAIPVVAAGATDFIKAIGSMLASPATEDFMAAATATATSIVSSIVQGIPKVVDGAKSIVGAIGDLIAGVDWSNALDDVTKIGAAVMNAVVEGINGLKDIGSSVIEAVGNLLGRIDWTKITISLDGFADMLINGVVHGLKSIQDLGTELANALATAVSKIPWAKVGEAASSLATSLLDGIVTGLKTITPNMDELISAMNRGVNEALSGLATTASTIIGALASYLVNPENLAEFASIGVQWVGKIVEGVLTLGVGMIETSADVLTNTIVGFFRGLFGIKVDPYVEQMMDSFFEAEFATSTRFSEYGKACGSALYQAMQMTLADSTSLENAVEAWGIAVENGYAHIMPEFSYLGNEAVVNLHRGMISELESGSGDVTATVEQAALLVGLGYGENLINALYSQNEELGLALNNFLESGFVDLEGLASKYGYDLGALMGFSLPEGYTMAIVDGEPAIVQASKDAMDAGYEAVASGWNIDELMSGLWDHTFDTAFAEIEKWKPELITLLEGMGIEAGSLLGVALPAGVADGLKNGTLSVEEAAAAIAAAAIATESQVNAATAANKAGGEKAGQGAADGTASAAPDVEAASKSLVDASETGVSGMPKVMTEASEKGGAGMEAGLLSSVPKVEVAAGTVSSAAVEEFLKTMNFDSGNAIGKEFGSGIQKGVSGQQPFITAATSAVAASAKNMASGIMSKAVGTGIGYLFSSGIAGGIISGIGLISAAASAAAQAALSAAKGALDIHSPSRKGEKEVGRMYDAGIARGIMRNYWMIGDAASDVAASMHDMFLIGDPSRGTVYTSAKSARQNAKEAAAQNAEDKSLLERARTMGAAIAEELINSGALDSDVYMDGEKTGRKTAAAVSRKINRDSKKTVSGRTGKAVFA